MIGQKKLHSLIEVVTNAVTSIMLAFLMNYYLLPIFGLAPTAKQALTITVFFATLGMIRGYVIRRIFNAWHIQANKELQL